MRSSLAVLASIFGFVLALGPGLDAYAADERAAEVRGHVIGEDTADFLRLEPELGYDASMCRGGADARTDQLLSEKTDIKQTDRPDCASLLAGLDRGQRAEITNSSAMEFVLDDGKLVRLTTWLDGETAAADLAKQFGSPSRETLIPGRDDTGAQWKNRLLVWERADASVTLYEDSDPSLRDRRALLILEPSANDYVQYTVSVQQLAALSASTRPPTHPKKSLAR